MSLTAWILAGAVVAVLALSAVLFVALRRSLARAVKTEELVSAARRAVRAAAEEEANIQAEQLRVTISRGHADSISAFAMEERRFSDQRRGELAVRERELSERLADALATVEQRVEERLRAWESDLERAQRALDGQIAVLEQHVRQRIAEVEARIETEATELGATSDAQRAAAIRLREELEESARSALAEALEELQMQASDRRRAVEEMADRARQHEQAIGEQVERVRAEAESQLEITFGELERRQGEQLERAMTREDDRLSEAGALEFDNRMRAIREQAASRLQVELDRTSESFLRRADMLMADQLQRTADAASQKLEERLTEIVRRFEASRSADVVSR